MRKVIKWILDLLIVILVILIGYYGYQFYEDYFKVKSEAKANYNQAVEKFTAPTEVCTDKSIRATENTSEISVTDFNSNQQIGYISAPTIGLQAALVMGDSEDGLQAAMNYGVSIDPNGLMPGTIGNTVIAGHREFAFKSLEDVPKDTPFIININGDFYTYKVAYAGIIEDTDVDKVFFNDGKERVVLYTCYPFAFNSEVTHRYMVYLEPVESVDINCEEL